MMTLALIWALQDDAVIQADALIEKLRGPLRARREATDGLLRLRRASNDVLPHLRGKLDATRDPVTRVRLDYIVGALIVEPAWTVDSQDLPGSPLAGDDRISIVAIRSDGRVIVLDAATGKRVHDTEPSAVFFARPVVVRDRAVLPLNYTNGPLLRFIDIERRERTVNHRGSALRPVAMARDGDRIFAMLAGRLVSLDLTKPADREWDVELRDECALAASGGRVLWANRRGRLTCVEAGTGRTVWAVEGPRVPRLTASAGLVVAHGAERIAAFDVAEGRKLWDRTVANQFSAVHAGAVLYAVGNDVTCVDAATGRVRWTDGALGAAVQSGQFAAEHVVMQNKRGLEFVSLRSGATDHMWPCEERLRGFAVSERFVLVWHGANQLTALRVAD